jgi:hypothetical protein
MATYEITGPDGSIYEIDGPEGASEQALIAAVQNQIAQEEKDTRQAEYDEKLAAIRATPEVVEEDDDGGFLDSITPDQVEEFLKGLGGGAAGLLESAALGAITPFAEETESSLRDTIQGIADPVQEFFSADEGSEDLVGRKLGEGVGSFLGILGAAAIPGVGLPLAGGLAVGAGAGEASERAREGDATEDERGLASLLGAGVGATELFTPLRMIKTFKKAIGETGTDLFFDKVKRIVTEAGVEGAQEFVAGVGQNLIEQGVYNPDQGTFEGSGEQFGVGAGVGGFVQAVFEIVTPRKRGGSDTTPPAEGESTAPSTTVGPLPEGEKEIQGPLPREEVVEAKATVPEEIDPFAEDKEVQGPKELQGPKEAQGPKPIKEVDTTTTETDPEPNFVMRGREAASTTALGANKEAIRIEKEIRQNVDDEAADEFKAGFKAERERQKKIQGMPQEEAIEYIDSEEGILKSAEDKVSKGVQFNDLTEDERVVYQREVVDPLAREQREERLGASVKADVGAREAVDTDTQTDVLPGDVKGPESKLGLNLQDAIRADLDKGKSQKEIFKDSFEKRLGFTQTQYKKEIQIVANRKKQEEADARGVEIQREAEQFDAKIAAKKPALKTVEQATPKITQEQSQKRIDEEIASLNKKTAGDKKWSTMTKNLGEKYKEIVPDRKDPMSVEDKTKVKKLLLSTVPAQKGGESAEVTANRSAKKFLSKFERPLDAFIVAGYETVFPSESVAQQKGAMSAEKQFFEGVDGKTGANLIRWMNKNMDTKTKTLVQDYINTKREEKTEETRAENRLTRRVKSLNAELKKKGKLDEVLTELYGEGTKKRTLTKADYIDYQRKISQKKAEKEDKKAEDEKREYVQTQLSDVVNNPDAAFKQNLRNKEARKAKKIADIKLKSVTPSLSGFLKMSTREINKLAREGRLSTANLSDAEYIELIEKRPTLDFDALEMSAADRKIAAVENEFLLVSAVEGLDDPISPVVKDQIKKGDLKGALKELQNTTNNPLVLKVASALVNNLGNTKLKTKKTLISDSKLEISGMYNIKDDTITLDSDTGINVHTLLHEATHAVTQKTLNKKSHYLTKQITTLFNDTKDMLDTAYGAESVQDFVAEAMSNPVFRQKLAGINPKGQPLSALEIFVNKIGNFLRTVFRLPSRAPEGSALTQVDLLVDGILSPTPGTRSTGDLTASSMIGQVEDLTTFLSNRANSVDNSANAKEGYLNRIAEVIGDRELGSKVKRFGLFGLPLQAVTDIAAKFKMGSTAVKLREIIESQVGETNNMDVRIDAVLKVFDSWINKNSTKVDTFNKLVYESTLDRVDPTKSISFYKGKTTEDGRDMQAIHKELNKLLSSVGPDGKKVYEEMRDVYSKIYKDLEGVVGRKIDSIVNDKKEATKIKAKIYAELFGSEKIEPYFPLTRKGDKWLAYEAFNKRTNTTEKVYEAFETVSARDKRIAELKTDTRVKDNQTIQPYMNLDQVIKSNSGPSSGLMGEMLGVLQKNQSSKPTKQEQDAYNATREELISLFISGLPETSFAKSMQKREDFLGFKEDSFDAFRTKAYDLSRQAIRLDYSNQIRGVEDQLRSDWKKGGSNENGLMVLNELLKRAEFSRNPPTGLSEQLAGNANRIAFLGTIGFNLSSAIVNLSQIPLMMLPILQGKYSKTGNGFSAISFASGIITSSGFSRKLSRVDMAQDKISASGAPSIDNYFEANKNGDLELRKDIDLSKMSDKKRKFIENDLKALVEEAGRRGGLNRSLYYDTLAIEQSGRKRSIWDTANAYSAFSFHQVERYNRQVAMTATYQLELQRMEKDPTAKESKLSLAEKRKLAAKQAIYQSQEMNGGATLSTAPRIAQQGIGRVALMYKSYGIQMYYTMFKTLDTALKGESAEVKKAARHQLYGIVLSSTLLAGASGLPLVGAVMAVANLFLDDEEDDAETILRKHIGEFAYKGPISSLLGTDISSRIGLSNLLFRDNPYNNDASDADLLLGIIGGPAWSVSQSFSRGIKDVNEGNLERGMEAMLPAAFRNVYKGLYRYPRDEGILTRRGDVIHDDISTGGLFSQIVGFPPTDYTLKQEQNQQVKKIDRAVNERRTKLLKKFYVATRMGDDTEDLIEDIVKYNNRHPQHAISTDSILRSLKMHYMSSAKMHNGVTLSPKNRAMLLDHMNEYDPF